MDHKADDPTDILYKNLASLRDEIRETHKSETRVDPEKVTTAELQGKLGDVLSFLADLASLTTETCAPLDEDDADDEEDDDDDAPDAMLDPEEGELITGLIAELKVSLETIRSATTDGEQQAALTRRMAECDRAIGIINDLISEEAEEE